MVTYLQLESEQEYHDEHEPPALADFNNKIRAKFGLSKSECGSKGDNNHLEGRHRSRLWDTNSIYCTDRSYATRDSRDVNADGNALRATDIGIQDKTLQDASKRLDTAVRSGKLPEVAEWFGTFDGKNVVGWFEGHSSSSDDSHLWHMHVGYWTKYTNDQNFFDRLYAVITNEEDDVTPEQNAQLANANANAYSAAFLTKDISIPYPGNGTTYNPTNYPSPLFKAISTMQADITELKNKPAGTVELTEEDIAAIASKVAELITPSINAAGAEARDAVGDFAEGGAEKVRKDED